MIKKTISNSILDALFGKVSNAAIPTGAACYLGLSTTTPSVGADGSITGFTEPASATGYRRVLLGMASQSATQKMDAASGGEIDNGTVEIHFNEATTGGGGYGTVTHFGLFAAASGGAPVLAGALTASVTIGENYVPIFRAGNLGATMA